MRLCLCLRFETAWLKLHCRAWWEFSKAQKIEAKRNEEEKARKSNEILHPNEHKNCWKKTFSSLPTFDFEMSTEMKSKLLTIQPCLMVKLPKSAMIKSQVAFLLLAGYEARTINILSNFHEFHISPHLKFLLFFLFSSFFFVLVLFIMLCFQKKSFFFSFLSKIWVYTIFQDILHLFIPFPSPGIIFPSLCFLLCFLFE